MLTNQVARVLERAAESQYPRGVVLELILLGALQNLSLVVPVALLLGIVLALGRLYHDSEMTAAQACGAGSRPVLLPVLAFTAVLTAVMAVLSLQVTPAAAGRMLDLRSEALRAGQFAPISCRQVPHFRRRQHGRVCAGAPTRTARCTGYSCERDRGDHARDRARAARHSRVFRRRRPAGHHPVRRRTLRGDPGRAALPHRAIRGEHHSGAPARARRRHRGARGRTDQRALVASNDPKQRAELHWRLALPIMARRHGHHRGAARATAAAPGALRARRLRDPDLLRLHRARDRRQGMARARRRARVVRAVVGARRGGAARRPRSCSCRAGWRARGIDATCATRPRPERPSHEPARPLHDSRGAGRRPGRDGGAADARRAVPVRRPAGRHRSGHLHDARCVHGSCCSTCRSRCTR